MAGVVLSHGLTTGITTYLAYLAGNWLDARFGTQPWLLAVLVLLTLAANLRLMIGDILRASETAPGNEQRRGSGGGEAENE